MGYFQKDIETMPREQIRQLQSERLVQTVKRVYDSVECYRKKMDEAGVKPEDIKGIEDITKLPFTVKHDLRENYPFGFVSADMSEITRIHASSGTTGKLTVAAYTKHDIDVWSDLFARCLAMVGADKNSKVHVAYGYGLFTGGLGAHYGAERLGAAAIPVSSGNTARQMSLLKDFQSDIICCTPSYAIYIADELSKFGVDKSELGLKAGVFGAEPWSEEMRKQIEEKLGIKAYDIYGLSEIMGPGVSMECEAQNGKHIWEDHFIAEIIDPNTLEPLDYGQVGELVLTTITKEGMPLIRYRTRDLCSLIPEKCSCGRTHVRMTRVLGRSDDMLIIRGVNVFPSQIESALLNVPELLPFYHINVDRRNMMDMIEVQIEMTEELFKAENEVRLAVKALTEKEINSSLGISVIVTLLAPNSLPRSEGKAKRVTDNRKY